MNKDSKIKLTKSGCAALVLSVTLIAIILAASVMTEPAAAGGGGRRSGTTEDCKESVCNVDMTGATFSPEIVQARPGATLVWSSSDKMPHTVTSGKSRTDIDPLFDTGILTPTSAGKLWELTFEKEGTFDYFCQMHPMMAGQVVIAGEHIGDATPLIHHLLIGSGVCGTFGAAMGVHLKLKKQRSK